MYSFSSYFASLLLNIFHPITILLNGLFYHVLFSSRFQNEEILKKATTDYQEKLKKSEEKYRLLKKHAEEKIERFVFVICTLAYSKQIQGCYDLFHLV